ncbi:MAG TPA: DUF1801 domain-containing protein [Blastocatellia bacterium]|jgi:hypothetical protein
MAELKTRPTSESVENFLNGIADEQRRRDCLRVVEIMKAATKSEPEMWGTSIVGFGRHNYKYESGTKGEWFQIGFSPRQQALTLYFMGGAERNPDLLKKLGKHKIGRACLYIKRLDDIDLPTLKQLIKRSVADIAKLKR